VYGAAAESVSRFMRKGSRVAIDGRLEWREWETSDQQRRQAVSIVADTVQFLDSLGERADSWQPPVDAAGDDPGADGSSGADRGPAGELVGVGSGAEKEELAF